MPLFSMQITLPQGKEDTKTFPNNSHQAPPTPLHPSFFLPILSLLPNPPPTLPFPPSSTTHPQSPTPSPIWECHHSLHPFFNPVSRPDPNPMTRRTSDRTHPFIWCIAVICTFVAIIIIISGVVIFVGYLFFHPKVPKVTVTYAHLDKFNYDQAGILNTHLTIYIQAINENIRAKASFSAFRYELSFHGLPVALLNNNPFDMGKNSTVVFGYPVESTYIPLDPNQMAIVQQSLAQQRVEFKLSGHTRSWWRVGPFKSPKFKLNLDCKLQFGADWSTTSASHCYSTVQ